MFRNRGIVVAIAALVLAAASIGLYFFSDWLRSKKGEDTSLLTQQNTAENTQGIAGNEMRKTDDTTLENEDAEIDSEIKALEQSDSEIDSSFNDSPENLQ